MKLLYNNQVFTGDKLIKMRGYLLLRCWKQVQYMRPFNYKDLQ